MIIKNWLCKELLKDLKDWNTKVALVMGSRPKQFKEFYLKVNADPIQDQNSPVKLKHGVYAEQLSGTAFTVKRSDNQKTWLYKVRPSAVQGQFHPSKREFKIIPDFINNENIDFHPNQLRWKPIPSVP